MTRDEMMTLISTKIYTVFKELQNNSSNSFPVRVLGSLPVGVLRGTYFFNTEIIKIILMDTNKYTIYLTDDCNRFTVDIYFSFENNVAEIRTEIGFQKDGGWESMQYFIENLQAIFESCKKIKEFCSDLEPVA